MQYNNLLNFILFYFNLSVIIYANMNESSSKCTQVTFEFYLTSFHQILESIQESHKTQHREENFEHTTSMDLDQVWVLALHILHMFEDTILSSYPSKITKIDVIEST